MGGSSKAQTVGYKYYLGVHMVFCHGPIDKITRIEFDDKVAWTGNATGGSISVSAENLFGGEEREGGVSGTFDIDMGGDSQTPNSYLVSKLGSLVPGFRGVVSAVLRQAYLGMNQYLKRPAFWGQRILVRQNGISQWYIAKAAIGQDMNPAHIIRECLTDPDWGMGYPEADIDDTSFQAAADQMYSESMGMSLLWDRSVTLEEFIQDVLKHIDGSLFVDRTSGKFVLKLARGGYDVSTLLVLDESSVNKISDFKRNTIGELINSVTVVYWDASTGKNNSVTVQDIALAAQQQSVVSTTKQFPGFTNGTIATKVAARSLKALSVPLASGTIYANRKAASLNIGDVFVLTWPRYGISQLVMRVANVELGALDSNVVKISAVEDVFALSSAIYAPPPPSGWTDPNNAPSPCPYHCVIEAPFWELCQRMSETDARSIPTTAGFVVATGVRPTSDAGNAKLYTNPTNTAYEEAGTVDFCPTALLGDAITPNQTVIPISGGIDLDVVKLNTYAIIDSELVVVRAISSSSMTVGRGVLDTVPVVHALGARVFFPDVYFETDSVEYATGETARIKLLPTTAKGTLAEASATAQTVTIQARAPRPYPPQKLRINSLAYPDTVQGDQNITVTWVHRDRLQQTATLVDTEAASIGPEANTTYTCRVLKQDGTVIATHSDLTSTSTTFTYSAPYVSSSHVHWRLRFTTSTGASDIWLDEVSFRDASGVDLSVGGTASSSGDYSESYPASAAFDKSTANAGWASNSLPCWIAYRHTSSVNVAKVIVTCADEAGASDELPTDSGVFLEYSDNGSTWTTAAQMQRDSGTWTPGSVVTLSPIMSSELGDNFGRLRVQLWAVRDGIQSLQMHDWEFTRSGYGTGYGYSYGGA